MESGITHLPLFRKPPGGDPDDLCRDISCSEDSETAGKLGLDKLTYRLNPRRTQSLGWTAGTRDEDTITLGRPQSVLFLVRLASGTYSVGACLKPGQDLNPGAAAKVRGLDISAPCVGMPNLGQVHLLGQNTLSAAKIRDSLHEGLFKREIVLLQKKKASVRKDELSVNQLC